MTKFDAFLIGLAIIGGFELLTNVAARVYWIYGYEWLTKCVAKAAVWAYDGVTG